MRIDPSRRRFAQGSLALGLMPWLAACGSDDDAPLEQQYTRTVQQAMARYFLPGVLAAVRVPGRTQWNGAFGKADLAANTPLSWDSTFPIRSVTKSFTVTLVLQLVREGVLALDHSLERYVAGAPNGQLITLADLAGMQSGLVDYSAQDGFLDLFIADPQRVWTERELVDFSGSMRPYIKRIIGVAGDTIEISDGRVYLNGNELHEPYVAASPWSDYGPGTVPDGHVFVMGDNRNNSDDSRGSVGFLRIDRIVGRAVLRYYPLSKTGVMRRPDVY